MSPAKKKPGPPAKGLTASEADAARNRVRTDKAEHQALIKIRYAPDGKMVEVPVAALGDYAPDFRKAILLVEDTTADSDRCRAILHDLGYDGIQLITSLQLAVDYLDDVLNNLTHPPDAIVLDLGLGYDSGFSVLRKCHGHPKLAEVPILVWTKHDDEHSEAFSTYLGAKDFMVKAADEGPFREALQRLLSPA
ncbi:MAG TPA: response regulator [Terriglobales bacterium]|nr:response regulator [Terriglobales bacterium]